MSANPVYSSPVPRNDPGMSVPSAHPALAGSSKQSLGYAHLIVMLPSARARPRAKSESKYIILKIYYYCYYAREARFINRDVVLDFCYETWLCYMIYAALFFSPGISKRK